MRSIAGFRHLPLADCMFAFVRFWPTPANSGDQPNVGLQGWSGNAGKLAQPTLMTHC
jgi:hypothetical protein